MNGGIRPTATVARLPLSVLIASVFSVLLITAGCDNVSNDGGNEYSVTVTAVELRNQDTDESVEVEGLPTRGAIILKD